MPFCASGLSDPWWSGDRRSDTSELFATAMWCNSDTLRIVVEHDVIYDTLSVWVCGVRVGVYHY